jgi:hypothetical protein
MTSLTNQQINTLTNKQLLARYIELTNKARELHQEIQEVSRKMRDNDL